MPHDHRLVSLNVLNGAPSIMPWPHQPPSLTSFSPSCALSLSLPFYPLPHMPADGSLLPLFPPPPHFSDMSLSFGAHLSHFAISRLRGRQSTARQVDRVRPQMSILLSRAHFLPHRRRHRRDLFTEKIAFITGTRELRERAGDNSRLDKSRPAGDTGPVLGRTWQYLGRRLGMLDTSLVPTWVCV